MNQNNDDAVKFIHYTLFSGSLATLDFHRKLTINTINPHSFCEAETDIIFKKALQNSDILLPDGIGVVLAHNLFNKKKIKKISGMDIFKNLIELLQNSKDIKNKKVFFLGATTHTLQNIKNRLNNECSKIEVNYYSPPYKKEFFGDDNIKMLNEINSFKPHILFVGMTAPKQEKWVYQNKNNIDAKIICSVGAVFDFYAETVRRPKALWIDLGLEWLVRFIKEPRRLWRRNLISSPRFIFKIFKYRIKPPSL